MIQDLRYGLRLLFKSPAFTVGAVLSLALGIGANSAMFSVLYAVLLRPLPYDHPEQLVSLREVAPGDGTTLENASPANYVDWTRRTRSFLAMGAYMDSYAGAYNLTSVKEPERVRAAGATAGFFDMLGVTPMLGRELRAGEQRADHTLVLSHSLWMRKFGGDPNVIGTQVALNDEPHTIIGVLAPDFRFRRNVEMWRQFTDAAGTSMTKERSTRWWSVVARLRPDATMRLAQAEVDVIADQLAREYPKENGGRRARLRPLHDDLLGAPALTLRVLYAAVCLVLLIACANVAGLLLARLAGRQREIGVRVALGAGRARLARQLLAESLLLAIPAAGVGLLLASWLVEGVVAIAPADVPRLDDVAINLEVVAFTVGISVVCAVAFGLTPIWHTGRLQPANALRQGRTITPVGEGLRGVLIVGEMAVAVVLLVGAGLLLRTYAHLTAVDPGFAPEHIATMEVGLQGPRYFDDWNRVVAFYDRALAELRTLPGVRVAAATSLVPFDEGRFQSRVAAAHDPGSAVLAEYRFVSPGYFAALDVPMQGGRDFSTIDRPGSPRVVILGASAASRLFGNSDPIGREIILRDRVRRVVIGTVTDAHLYALNSNPPLQVYAPFPQADDVFWSGLKFVIRTDADPLLVAASARQRLLAVDRGLPPFNVTTLDSLISQSIAPARMYVTVLSVFALLALLLASVGLYGLISYVVTRRTQEFGIRLALGARAIDLRALVFRESARLVALALAIGVVTALVAARVLSASLFEVTPTDWPTLSVVVLVLVTVASAASYLPARHAMSVDPITTLRTE